MNNKVKWITETAVMIALLVTLQYVTKAGGQFVTGSCVNLILAVAALVGGLWCGVTVALVSPFFAFLLGIGPQLIQIVPCIALGNAVYVILLALIAGKIMDRSSSGKLALSYCAMAVAALGKFAALFLVIVKLVLPSLGLAEAQVTTMSAMFSWPQLVTALIGGVLAVSVAPLLRKALRY